jgi:hypothetical protein
MKIGKLHIDTIPNGWTAAPHHWWRYLLLPFRFDCSLPIRYPGWWSIGLFGFVWFFSIER